jgi:hypothetical protein
MALLPGVSPAEAPRAGSTRGVRPLPSFSLGRGDRVVLRDSTLVERDQAYGSAAQAQIVGGK